MKKIAKLFLFLLPFLSLVTSTAQTLKIDENQISRQVDLKDEADKLVQEFNKKFTPFGAKILLIAQDGEPTMTSSGRELATIEIPMIFTTNQKTLDAIVELFSPFEINKNTKCAVLPIEGAFGKLPDYSLYTINKFTSSQRDFCIPTKMRMRLYDLCKDFNGYQINAPLKFQLGIEYEDGRIEKLAPTPSVQTDMAAIMSGRPTPSQLPTKIAEVYPMTPRINYCHHLPKDQKFKVIEYIKIDKLKDLKRFVVVGIQKLP